MPKMKTHSGAAKRFRRTSSGRYKCRRGTRNHILTKRTTKNKRGLRTHGTNIKLCDQKMIDKMLLIS